MINTDNGYCTAQLDGEMCPIRDECDRYSKEALECDTPLWWTDGVYDFEKQKCDYMDLKTAPQGE